MHFLAMNLAYFGIAGILLAITASAIQLIAMQSMVKGEDINVFWRFMPVVLFWGSATISLWLFVIGVIANLLGK